MLVLKTAVTCSRTFRASLAERGSQRHSMVSFTLVISSLSEPSCEILEIEKCLKKNSAPLSDCRMMKHHLRLVLKR
jgi:hypothetical protein